MIRSAVFALSFLMNLRFKQVNDVLMLWKRTFNVNVVDFNFSMSCGLVIF